MKIIVAESLSGTVNGLFSLGACWAAVWGMEQWHPPTCLLLCPCLNLQGRIGGRQQARKAPTQVLQACSYWWQYPQTSAAGCTRLLPQSRNSGWVAQSNEARLKGFVSWSLSDELVSQKRSTFLKVQSVFSLQNLIFQTVCLWLLQPVWLLPFKCMKAEHLEYSDMLPSYRLKKKKGFCLFKDFSPFVEEPENGVLVWS